MSFLVYGARAKLRPTPLQEQIPKSVRRLEVVTKLVPHVFVQIVCIAKQTDVNVDKENAEDAENHEEDLQKEVEAGIRWPIVDLTVEGCVVQLSCDHRIDAFKLPQIEILQKDQAVDFHESEQGHVQEGESWGFQVFDNRQAPIDLKTCNAHNNNP